MATITIIIIIIIEIVSFDTERQKDETFYFDDDVDPFRFFKIELNCLLQSLNLRKKKNRIEFECYLTMNFNKSNKCCLFTQNVAQF